MNYFRLLFYNFLYFTDLRNKMYQFILFLQPFFFLFMIKFMLEIRPNINEDKYVIAVGILGAWNYILYSSGSSLIMEKWLDTFNLMIASRYSLFKLVLCKAINNTLIGTGTFFITLIYAKFLFLFEINIENIIYFLLSFFSLLLGLVSIGIVLAIVFCLFTNVFEYQNLIVYPILILSGVFYPVEMFPTFIKVICYMVPMSWSISNLYLSLDSQSAISYSELSVAVLISTFYIIVSYLIIRRLEYKFRDSSEIGVV
jgi:ABC-2 type transport system permease protein